jgi:environmental stress-induced protein Ves
MQIIRKSSFAATPWKNGGGITHEAIRVPANGTEFRWRVSVAQIEASGPFSDFAGYNRTMVLLRGSGIRLSFAGGQQTFLREAGELVEFDGALATQCDLLGGPCADLNLMVSKSMKGARASVEHLRQPRTLHSLQGETTLVFGIDGALSIDSVNGGLALLDPWDLAILSPQDSAVVSPEAPTQSPAPLVFIAMVDTD